MNRLLPFLSLVLLLGGCAGTDGSARTVTAPGVTRFQSSPVRMQLDLRGDPLGGRRNLAVRAFATCEGAGCRPDRVTLSFTNEGSTPIEGDYRSLRIEADTLARFWDDIHFGGTEQRSLPTGQFLRVEVEPGFFAALAEAEEAHIVLGSTLYRLPEGRRATFRRMLERIRAASSSPE